MHHQVPGGSISSDRRTDRERRNVNSRQKKTSRNSETERGDRLASTIFLITVEAAVVPRGALFRRPDGVIVENLSFEGLTTLDAREIGSFLPLQRAH
nr:unnamed protein product [Callosobruchus chinensis]